MVHGEWLLQLTVGFVSNWSVLFLFPQEHFLYHVVGTFISEVRVENDFHFHRKCIFLIVLTVNLVLRALAV